MFRQQALPVDIHGKSCSWLCPAVACFSVFFPVLFARLCKAVLVKVFHLAGRAHKS